MGRGKHSNHTGRYSIFPGKSARYNGRVTDIAATSFEAARARLAVLDGKGHTPDEISDGDVIEFLARGEKATKQYLKQRG